ncbi:MAG: hypothetical protein HAW63_03360 [Bdellovibrionaceae bacterium]|nr:hypothetical protein [Pseudobdellovibrionaceae bacterium]
MKIPFITMFFVIILSSFNLSAKVSKHTVAKSTSNLKTNISFEDALVNAKHHGVGEAVITVGADKVLDALLGVKKDFKKRIKKSFYKF